MKRYLRWGALLGVWLACALVGKAQDTSGKALNVSDSIVVDSMVAQVVPAAASEVSSESTGIDFSTQIEGTPFSLLTLVVIALLAVGALIAVLLYILEQSIHLQAIKVESQPDKRPLHARLSMLYENLKMLRKLFTVGMAVFIVGFWIHHQIKGSPWEGHVNEWMNLIVRWGHVTFGVAWIGASFYFIFLENALYRGPGIRDGLAGNLWAIHGGGFYYVEKYKVAPEKLPAHLHWFKWEAYITWISGICLLFVVYYFNASSLLVDKNVADISNGTAIAIGICTLVASWLVYDILCKSPLVLNKPVFFFLMFGLITLIAFFLSQWLSPRAAYIHVGAVIGTMMAGNVWRVIIPSQKAMVKAAEEGKEVNPELGKHAGLRSLHNNYFTLPVLFIMISNHFPSTYGNTLNWAVLGALTLISAGVKHYFNLKDKGEKNPFLIPAASIGMMIVFFATAPRTASEGTSNDQKMEKVQFYQVYQTVVRRCTPCHSANPIDDANVVAPNGIMLDTPDQIIAQKDRIMVRAVVTKTMPQNNKTEMTDAERELIGRWISQGGSEK
jgi:uncharacterized membrane protein